jgi:tetratricopeptide (TPR) repeat protein
MKISVLTSRSTPGFRHAALIESDPHFVRQIQSYAEDIGVMQLDVIENVEALLDPKARAYDLLIMDWNARGPNSGISAYNRLRQGPGWSSVPILVISGFVDRNDFRLLEEFPLTRLVEKPFTAGVFIEAVQSLRNELDWVHAHDKTLRRLLQADGIQGLPRVRKIQKLLKSAPYPAPLLLMVGRYLSREKCWEEARTFLQEVVRQDRRNVLALNELGKVLHACGRHREAIAVLTEADSLSPDNLKRICHLGELHLHTCQLREARHSFERALTIDAACERARKGHDLSVNALEFLQKETESGFFPQSFASLMNTIGITKVRSGYLDAGIHHYESALQFLRDDEVRAKVMFNMGLGYLRHQQSDKALLWFTRSARTGGPAYAKARTYVEELTQKAVWTEEGLSVVRDVTESLDAQDHVSTALRSRSRKSESMVMPSEPISLLSEDGSDNGVLSLEDFDTDALLSGVSDEEFC